MTATDYTDWTIRYGFLDGNLGNGDEPAHASKYADCVADALKAAYPGATIEVPWQRNSEGSLPCGLRPLVVDADGNERDDEQRRIHRIAEDVFASGVWLE